MMYKITDHLHEREHAVPDERALFAFAQDVVPWSLDPPPASAEDLADRIDQVQLWSCTAEPEGPPVMAEPPPDERMWEAARLRAGVADPRDPAAHRAAQVTHEGEETAVAMAACDLDPADADLRQQVGTLAALLSAAPASLAKAEPLPATTTFAAVSPNAGPVAAALRAAAAEGRITPFEGGGKHSKGMLLASTRAGEWLIKPGSGKHSPILGVGDQPASQAQREVACAYALKAMDLERYAVRAELVQMDGKPVAVLEYLPAGKGGYQLLGKALRADPSGTQLRLLPLLATGTLHRIALALFVLAEGDANNQNMMTRPEDPLRLIDHGSALAGDAFDPATDPASYVPACLRAWAPKGWARLPPDERLAALPRLAAGAETELRAWWAGVDRSALQAALQSNGADPGPTLRRAAEVSRLMAAERADVVVNRLWSVGA